MDIKRLAHRNLPAFATGISVVSLTGWAFGAYLLAGWLPGAALSKVNAAICVILLCGALYLVQFQHGVGRRSARILSMAAVTIAGLTILQYVAHIDLGIDQALMADPTDGVFPGRMSPLSAMTIALVGVAIIGETLPNRFHPLLAPTLYSLSLFLALSALLGYLYGVPILYGTGGTTRVAFPSAVSLTLVSVGGLLSTSERSYVRLFLGSGPLARGARRMVLVAITMPAIALWLRAPAERVGLIDPQSGAALMALSTMPLLVLAVWWTVREISLYQNQVLAMQLQLEKRVEERTLELERANKELEAFNYSVSHDLRNPLHIVRGGTSIILRDPTPETISEFGNDVKNAADRMNEIIESLLKLSRISRAELERQPIDLSKLAEDVLQEVTANDPERRYEAIIRPGLEADGDPSLLRIVLENLVSNAWKFTRGQATARIEFGSELTDRGLCFYVRDNGVGFDMNQSDRLFQPFHRLHRREDFEGTGVGLATVARIVQRHGGQVFARGSPGQGATIYFSLPPGRRFRPVSVRLVTPTANNAPTVGAASSTPTAP